MNQTETRRNLREFQVSLSLLKSTLSPTIIYILIGFIALATGVTALVVIVKNKELHTKFFFLLACVFVNDAVMGTAYIGMAAQRFYREVTKLGEVTSRKTCCLESTVLYFSQTCSLYFVLGLVSDRMLSVVKPLLYKDISWKHETIPLIFIALFLSAMETGVMLYTGFESDDGDVPLCGTANCWPVDSYKLTLHLSISVIIVVLNITLIYLIRKAKRFNQQQINVAVVGWFANATIPVHLKVTKTLVIMVISHATSHLSTRLGLLVMLYQTSTDPEISLVGLVLRNLVLVNAATNVFIYYFTSSEFKMSFKKTLKKTFSGTSSTFSLNFD